MQIIIDEDTYHTVHIEGDFVGPYIDLDLTPRDAYNLLRRLEEKKTQLYDLATNYYECKTCGGHLHLNSAKICPNVEREEA